jgi:aromatic ring-opening dioxygenase catalytic subunit (LigB family)
LRICNSLERAALFRYRPIGRILAAMTAHEDSPMLHDAKAAGPSALMPTLYIPHGGGPCFFMEWTMGPKDTWDAMAAWLRALPNTLPAKPKALLVISAHWESDVPAVTTAAVSSLLFDYSGFPKHTYELRWPAPGAPALAARVRALLAEAGLPSRDEDKRGLDHGVFVPLKVAFPDADIPTVQLSLRRGLSPEAHLAIGRALAPLRQEGVLIVGSGMSYHNMRGFMNPASLAHSQRFDAWLEQSAKENQPARDKALAAWRAAPNGVDAHPREEHLIPLMVAAGAAGGAPGQVVFRGEVMGVVVSALQFG